MWFKSLRSRKVSELGASLAANFIDTAPEKSARKRNKGAGRDAQIQRFLAQVDREAMPLKLGLFGRAKLANAFKWHLLENGFEPEVVDELTRMLLLRLSAKPG